MKDSAKYAKIVEQSEEDQCYVGSAPGLILGGCHGDDEKQVFEELCLIQKKILGLKAFCQVRSRARVRLHLSDGYSDDRRLNNQAKVKKLSVTVG